MIYILKFIFMVLLMAKKNVVKSRKSSTNTKTSNLDFEKKTKTELISIIKEKEKWIRKLESEFESRSYELEKTNIRVMHLLRMKRQFFDKVAFGIRSFLTPIEIPLKLIADSKLDKKNQMRISIVLKNIEYLNTLVDNVLDVAKVDGGVIYGSKKINLAELVETKIKSRSDEFKNSNIRITKKLDKKQEPIWIDEEKVSKVIDNVISNAIKYSKDGDRKIIFECYEKDGSIFVSISDLGIGIEKKDINKIFEDFYKVSIEDDGSLGLGLSIAEKIINVHGGKIWAESKGLGKGTKITFNIPLNKEM